jgi:hypothetical protein
MTPEEKSREKQRTVCRTVTRAGNRHLPSMAEEKGKFKATQPLAAA